jgi:hypothetical protein
MQLEPLVRDIADAIVRLDLSRAKFRSFLPGAGPYGEPQLVKFIANELNQLPQYKESVCTKRNPDLLIPNQWAIEFKITRPFGDNGREAESWSVNLLHPYPGNVSTIGDCIKLTNYKGMERRASIVIGYEHSPPKIDLTMLIASFEMVAKHVVKLNLSDRVEIRRENLIHPIHQSLRVFAWEVLPGVTFPPQSEHNEI